jgi:hypothetical protein
MRGRGSFRETRTLQRALVLALFFGVAFVLVHALNWRRLSAASTSVLTTRLHQARGATLRAEARSTSLVLDTSPIEALPTNPAPPVIPTLSIDYCPNP